MQDDTINLVSLSCSFSYELGHGWLAKKEGREEESEEI